MRGDVRGSSIRPLRRAFLIDALDDSLDPCFGSAARQLLVRRAIQQPVPNVGSVELAARARVEDGKGPATLVAKMRRDRRDCANSGDPRPPSYSDPSCSSL